MHMGHIALRVADLDASTAHAVEQLGLEQTAIGGGCARFSANEKHHELELIAADESALDHIGIEVDTPDELDFTYDRLAALGTELLPAADDEQLQRAFRVRAPSNVVFEIYHGMERRPVSVASAFAGPLRKFGHATIVCRDRSELVEFLIEGLGFRLSDTLGRFAWLRCDADHHGMAVASEAAEDHLHHYAFELTGWGAMRDILDQVASVGARALWGPVRHGPGFNISAYIPEPNGALVEVYTELQRIEVDSAHQPIDWDSVDGPRNLWGKEPDEDFINRGIPLGTTAHVA
jgi:catechol 2,3-dioxygenase